MRLAGRKDDPDKPVVRPLFDDNVYQRGEVLVLKPALSGAFQGFEANRGACGTLKHRCPAAAFGCAGRKECHRARQAGEPSASTSITADSSRRPLGQPLLEAGTAVPPRIYSRVDNAYRMEKHYIRGLRQMRLRLGLVTVVATALGCLRAKRQGGRWLARSGCATDRVGRPTAPPP